MRKWRLKNEKQHEIYEIHTYINLLSALSDGINYPMQIIYIHALFFRVNLSKLCYCSFMKILFFTSMCVFFISIAYWFYVNRFKIFYIKC